MGAEYTLVSVAKTDFSHEAAVLVIAVVSSCTEALCLALDGGMIRSRESGTVRYTGGRRKRGLANSRARVLLNINEGQEGLALYTLALTLSERVKWCKLRS